jgi:hypothetical protein
MGGVGALIKNLLYVKRKKETDRGRYIQMNMKKKKHI